MRYLGYRQDNGFLSMGIDEALLILRSEDKIDDTFRFYSFSPSCVSIGYFQNINLSIDLDFCDKNKIDFVRRITGGGNVFHDSLGEITYSIIISEDKVPGDILNSFEFLYKGVLKGLEKLNIFPEFKPLNDLALNSKKISGSAQTRKNGVILQHGTVMYNTNIDIMEKVLKIPNKKVDVKKRVTTLYNEGFRYDKDIIIDNLKKGFIDIFGKIKEDKINNKELEIAKKLANEKYSSINWNFRR